MIRRRVSVLVAVCLLSIGLPAHSQALLWTRVSGSSQYDEGLAVTVDGERNVYVVGRVQGKVDGQRRIGSEDMCLIKYDASGKRLWTRLYGADGAYAAAMVVDPSNNLYIAGNFWAPFQGHKKIAGQNDLFLLKLDGSGNQIWMRTSGSSGADYASGLAIGSSGNIYMAGYSSAAPDSKRKAGSYDIVLLKYNPAGDTQWRRIRGTGTNDMAHGMALDAQENIYIAGQTVGPVSLPNYQLEDAYVAKYDRDGTKQWEQTFGTERIDSARQVAVDSFGNVYVTGYSDGPLDGVNPAGNPTGSFLSKLDSSGKRLWTHPVGPVTLGGLAIDVTDHLYIAGHGHFAGHRGAGDKDFVLVQYDPDGAIRWSRVWGSSAEDWITAMALDGEGLVYLTGQTSGKLGGLKNAGHSDVCAMKYTPHPPSFDCGKASSVQETLICESARLSALDSEIQRLYEASLARGASMDQVKADQVQWLKTKRNVVVTSAELAACLQERVDALKATLPGSR